MDNEVFESDYTRYRPAWVAIFRQQSIAKGLHFTFFGALALSLFGLVPRPPARGVAIFLLLVSIAAHVVIRCPRCRAWWRLGTDDDGQRKPCARCGLRWGQEDETPEV